MLLAVDPARLADLRWERSRDDALFPHLYGPLELDAVTRRTGCPTTSTPPTPSLTCSPGYRADAVPAPGQPNHVPPAVSLRRPA